MTENGLFALSPGGLTGMVKLSAFLDTLKERGIIGEWHPGRWESYLKLRTTISFDDSQDEVTAARLWDDAEARERAV